MLIGYNLRCVLYDGMKRFDFNVFIPVMPPNKLFISIDN